MIYITSYTCFFLSLLLWYSKLSPKIFLKKHVDDMDNSTMLSYQSSIWWRSCLQFLLVVATMCFTSTHPTVALASLNQDYFFFLWNLCFPTSAGKKNPRYFGLCLSRSTTEISPFSCKSFSILQSSLLPSKNEKCHGLQCTAVSSLPLHPGGQVHQDAQDLPDLLLDQKNLLDHALLGHPRKIPTGY